MAKRKVEVLSFSPWRGAGEYLEWNLCRTEMEPKVEFYQDSTLMAVQVEINGFTDFYLTEEFRRVPGYPVWIVSEQGKFKTSPWILRAIELLDQGEEWIRECIIHALSDIMRGE